jgi:hypothetical protein
MIQQNIEQLRLLQDNWNNENSEAPSAEAINQALSLLGAIDKARLLPHSAGPDAEGGAGFWFESSDDATRSCWLVCLNSGHILAMLTDHANEEQGCTFQVDPATIPNALDRILAFLQPGG